MSDVEILWPEPADPAALRDAEAMLDDAGLSRSSLVVPTRRGPEMAVVVLLGSLLQPFAHALVQRAAGDVYPALQSFVLRMLGRQASARAAPTSVVFRSTASSSEFVFTAGLPEEAFREAVELDTGDEPGRWAWDPASRSWTRFEDLVDQTSRSTS